MTSAIEVRGLTKSYGGRAVLKGLSLEIKRGEVFALLGVNGAGKTTALECIEGLRKYEAGTVTVRGSIGVQLQSSSLPAYIKPMEAAKLFAKWHKTPIDHKMLNLLGIGEMKKRYSELSTGQKRRLHLALALTGDPDIVFLDEPTSGLDVEGRQALHSQIKMLKSLGKTIIIASHDMAEVETLCDRIAVLNGGKITFCGTISELTAAVGKKYTVLVKTACENISLETDDITGTLLNLLSDLKSRGTEVMDISVTRGTLEQHFIELVRGKSK